MLSGGMQYLRHKVGRRVSAGRAFVAVRNGYSADFHFRMRALSTNCILFLGASAHPEADLCSKHQDHVTMQYTGSGSGGLGQVE